MNLTPNLLLLIMSIILIGCRDGSDPVSKADSREFADSGFHAKSLEIDERYQQEIVFGAFDIATRLPENHYVRIDRSVADVSIHQDELLKELGVTGAKIFYTNPATAGRCMHLKFGDGKECAFVWGAQANDPRITKARIEHEKYHAVSRLKPESIQQLSNHLAHLGFNLDLAQHDEELAATIVEVFSIHRDGVPLERLSGSDLGAEAVGLLKASRR